MIDSIVSDEDLRFAVQAGDQSWAQGVVAPKRAFDAPAYLRLLGYEEQRYAAGLQRPSRRQEFIHGRCLLRAMLALQAGESMAAQEISTGRPQLVEQQPSPALALTHSPEHLAAMVAGTGSLGIDLEQVRYDHDLVPTADYLGWGDWLRNAASADHWMWWTLWEASQKLQGQSVLTRDNPVFAQLLEAQPVEVDRFYVRRSDALIAVSSAVASGVWFSFVAQHDDLARPELALIWGDRLVPIPSP